MTARRMAVGVGLVALFAGSAHAQLQPPAQVGLPSVVELRAAELTSSAIGAENMQDYAAALGAADAAIRTNPNGPWGYYVRGDALLAQGRVDDAVTSYHDAEVRFSDTDVWGKSVAIWAAANALQEARPCRDATVSYERYAAFVERLDPAAAAMARAASRTHCVPLAPAPYSELDPAWEHYRQGDALAREHRVDEAVASYRRAEQGLPESAAWARSIAIWGQANALKEAGHCAEASPIFQRYADFVAARDPKAAALGREYAKKKCVPLRASR